MRSNYKVNIVIMEGADCCGKTSQTRSLSKALKNSIVIHHPTKKTIEKSDTIKLMNNIIYNKDWLDNVFNKLDRSVLEPDLFNDVDAEMKRMENIIRSNIHQNYEDQIHTLKMLNRIYNPDTTTDDNEVYDFLEKNCQCVYDGEILENGSSKFRPKVRELLKKFRCDPYETYVVFDRFFISAECYNSYIVSERLKYIMDKLRESIFFKINDLSTYEEKFKREVNYVHSLTLHRSNDIIKQLNKLVVNMSDDKVYLMSKYKNNTTKCKETYPITAFNMLDPRVQTFVFRPSELLYKTTISCREVSDYDINSFIHEKSDEFYNNISDVIFKLTTFDYIITEYIDNNTRVLHSPEEILDVLLTKCENKFVNNDNERALDEYLKHYVI